jgi:hypothetical protein
LRLELGRHAADQNARVQLFELVPARPCFHPAEV